MAARLAAGVDLRRWPGLQPRSVGVGWACRRKPGGGAGGAGQGEPVSQLNKLVKAFRREELVHYQAQLHSLEQFSATLSSWSRSCCARPGKEPRRLVVFVDDLDRCLPEKAIQVLEALKLFLDVKGCIFVLGLDPEAIESAVRTRYQEEIKPREYLEKIIQVPLSCRPSRTSR